MVEFRYLLPELVLLLTACLVLIGQFFIKNKRFSLSYCLTQFGLIVNLLILFFYYLYGDVVYLFQESYIFDLLALLLKAGTMIMAILFFVHSQSYIASKNILEGEYYSLCLFSLLGMHILISAGSFLVLYLGLELMSLPLYALVVMDKDSQITPEAGMKYFILGALATGLFLYGISLIYAATGSINFSQIAEITFSDNLLLTIGLVFIIVGIGFKLGVVPFHMWAPDVYAGGPTSSVLFLASLPKLAIFAMTFRVLTQALPGLVIDWQMLLFGVAIISIVFGNVVAIAQTNIKRLFAYSAIAHMGFVLLGLASASFSGAAGALFYILTYAFMTLGAFAVIMIVGGKDFDADNINDYKGLHARNPYCAFTMMLVLFSMAGIPPTVGFYAKLTIFTSLAEQGNWFIAIIAILFSVVGAFYYLRLIKNMYFEEPEDPAPVLFNNNSRIMLLVNGLGLLVFGIFPSGLLTICAMAFL